MPNDTLTLALNGDVSLEDFANAMENFNKLVQGLTTEIARDSSIEWVIDSLQNGSAIATVKGDTDRLDTLAAIISAFSSVGNALKTHQPIPYPSVREPAQNLTRLLNGKITSIRFETATEDIFIESHYKSGHPLKLTYAYGRLKGTIQTLSMRRGVHFTLYDVLFDRPVNGYLKEGQQELIREYWGKKVFVSGRICRDPDTGKPLNIRDVSEIEVVNSKPGGFRRAIGIIELKQGETPEEIIRGIRNG
jgi:hypothetical protein